MPHDSYAPARPSAAAGFSTGSPKAPVKLLTVWAGPLPDWMPHFVERVRANGETLRWQLVPFDPADFRARVRRTTWVEPPPVITPLKTCDYRGAYGKMFADLYAGHGWWGWCDLDVVFGDVGKWLGPWLRMPDGPELVTDDNWGPYGAFTVLRNTPRMTGLYRAVCPMNLGPRMELRAADYRDVFADPGYRNFDESGLIAQVRWWGVRTACTGTRTTDVQFDPRDVRLDGNTMRTRGETTCYHFYRTKRWPAGLPGGTP
jgi:hypothetical protein